MFDGRTLDDNVIKASYVLDDEWARATGSWVLPAKARRMARALRIDDTRTHHCPARAVYICADLYSTRLTMADMHT